jgi:site-specific recombinase XerD
MTAETTDFDALPGTDLVARTDQVPAALRDAVARAGDMARAGQASATRRAYRSDFALFAAWCARHGAVALPALPEIVAAFLTDEAGRGIKASTIGRRAAAICHAHRMAGHAPPTADDRVKLTMAGIRRSIGTAPNKKAAATADKLFAMTAQAGQTLAAVRDRAVLLLGFAMAARRSELVALDLADIEEVAEGLRVTIRGSKTDQDREGAVVAIPRGVIACPVAALKAWLAVAGITEGPLFRPINKSGKVGTARLTAQSVALIVKAGARRAGLDPRQFSAHSLRAGWITSAAKRRASIPKMMDVSRHKSIDTLLGYVRDAELFHDHAGAGLL